jgi:hypothetical protein
VVKDAKPAKIAKTASTPKATNKSAGAKKVATVKTGGGRGK